MIRHIDNIILYIITEVIMKKKVLLLSISAGQGHHSTAQALMNYLRELNVECTMLDTYKYINSLLGGTIDKGYSYSTIYAPKAYKYFYRALEKKHKSGKISLTNMVNSIFAIKLEEYLQQFNPDLIVCTHTFTAILCSVLKRQGKLNKKTIAIITDYTMHPFWDDTDNIDYYVTASELLYNQAIKKGLDGKKLLPFGIPIRPAFSKKIDKLEAREQLNIDKDKFTILLMGGGAGYGRMDKIVEAVDKLEMDFQILAVCGRNERMRKKIERIESRKKIYVYGFVDYVNVMMDAADCIITKPGGLTTSEALAKQLPIIMINPIPGQEDRNVEFLLNNGLAMLVSKTFPVDECIFELFYNKERLEIMRKNIQLIGKPNSTRDICDFIMKELEANNEKHD